MGNIRYYTDIEFVRSNSNFKTQIASLEMKQFARAFLEKFSELEARFGEERTKRRRDEETRPSILQSQDARPGMTRE